MPDLSDEEYLKIIKGENLDSLLAILGGAKVACKELAEGRHVPISTNAIERICYLTARELVRRSR